MWRHRRSPVTLEVFRSENSWHGWWCRLKKPGLTMERGPYQFKWMAQLAFPIQRWTWGWEKD